MKFGRRLLEEAHPQYRHFYIAYKDLKHAIRVITGTLSGQKTTYSIREVTSNFGNAPAFSGSVFRPPEARFQDLLNGEKEKINKFMEVTMSACNTALRKALKGLTRAQDEQTLDELEAAIEEQADQLTFLDSYQRLNHTGFRKITKKYDKHNNSNSSAWYMAQLSREPFLNADFATPLTCLSICFEKLREKRYGIPPAHLSEDIGESPRVYKSSKYFIRQEDLIKLKILLLKFVPIASVGEDVVDKEKSTNRFLHQVLPGIDGDAGIVAAHQSGPRSRILSHCHVYFDVKDFVLYRLGHSARHIKEISGTSFKEPSKESLPSREVIPPSKSASKEGNDEESRSAQASKDALPASHESQPEERRAPSFRRGQKDRPLEEKAEEAEHRNSLEKILSAQKRIFTYRLKWYGINNGEPEKDIILEYVDINEPASSPHELPLRAQDLPNAVVLKQKHVMALLNGQFDIKAWISRKKMTPERAEEVKVFLFKAHEAFRSRGLGPVVQVWFYRTTFRLALPGNNPADGICAHIDEKVSFVRELVLGPDGLIDFHKEPDTGHLKITPFIEARSEESVDQLTLGVLSISYPRDGAFPWEKNKAFEAVKDIPTDAPAEENPGHIEGRLDVSSFVDLITGLTSVTEVWSFSYFIHGVSFTARDLNVPDLPVPHWFNFLALGDKEDANSDKKSEDLHQDSPSVKYTSGGAPYSGAPYSTHGSGPIAGGSSHIGGQGIGGQGRLSVPRRQVPTGSHNSHGSNMEILKNSPGERVMRDHEIHTGGFITPKAPEDQIDSLLNDTESALMPIPARFDGGGADEARMGVNGGGGFLKLHAAINVTEHDSPQRPLCDLTQPLLAQGQHERNRSSEESRRHGWVSTLRNCCRALWPTESAPEPSARVISAAVRIEPKTFFANERTLLQWMNTGVLLATIAVTLLNFGSYTTRLAGFIMGPVAIYFIIHSYTIYSRRSQALLRKEPIDYTDQRGPFLLVASLVAALSIVIGANLIDVHRSG